MRNKSPVTWGNKKVFLSLIQTFLTLWGPWTPLGVSQRQWAPPQKVFKCIKFVDLEKETMMLK
jgi:hypothetical protein